VAADHRPTNEAGAANPWAAKRRPASEAAGAAECRTAYATARKSRTTPALRVGGFNARRNQNQGCSTSRQDHLHGRLLHKLRVAPIHSNANAFDIESNRTLRQISAVALTICSWSDSICGDGLRQFDIRKRAS
jgi:hypothetical protein